MREQYGACSQREGGAKGWTESAPCHSSERGRGAERQVLGEVEGERQEQWGGQERDRRVKTQKDSEKRRWRQGETNRNPPRKDTLTVFSCSLIPSQRDGGMDRPREGWHLRSACSILRQLHAAPYPPLPSVPLPRPLICKILGFAGTLNPYGADSFPSKSSP